MYQQALHLSGFEYYQGLRKGEERTQDLSLLVLVYTLR